MRKLVAVLAALIAGIAAAIALADTGPTTGTNTSCATATTPAHTVGVDGADIHTIPGDSQTSCHVETYTIPTNTETVTVTTPATTPTDTTPTTTTTPPPTPGTNCAVLGSNGQPDAATLDACGYPSPNTTGPTRTPTPIAQATLPAGAKWSAGTLTIGANTTVTGVDIEGGTVNITGNNAQLNNSKVVCGSGDDCIVNNGHTGSSLSDDTIQGTGNTGNGLCIRAIHMEQDVSMIVKRAYITNCTDGVVGLSNTSDSYININGTYQGSSGPTHNEPIYLPGGNTTSADIEHNTLLMNQNQVAAVFGDDHAYGPLHKVTINNNLLASSGSNGFVATGKAGDGNTAIVVTNNRFSYIFSANESTGGNAPPPATTWSGNYRDDTLATVAFK